MWCGGAFVASSALNAFVALLLRTQDPGNDNTWRLSAAVLMLHTLGLLQSIVPSGALAYLQWAASAPLVCWLVAQLLATLPPGATGGLTPRGLFRCAAVEVALAAVGLLTLLLAPELVLVRVSVGVVSVTVMFIELVPNLTPYLPSYLVPTRLLSYTGNGGGGAAASSGGGSGFGSRYGGSRSPQRGLTGGGAGGGYGFGAASATAAGGSGSSLPRPMEQLLGCMAVGKLLQAVSAAVVGATSLGRGLDAFVQRPEPLPMTLWSLTMAMALYGLPLAVCTYYGFVRYAASMLVSRRSTLRRVSSLGVNWSGTEEGPAAGGPLPGLSGGSQGRGSVGAAHLSSLRRNPLAWAGGSGGGPGGGGGGGGGGDSDSDSGLPLLPSRLLEIGELYRITESSGHSVSYSTSGDESWRNDLALTQLLYMARTTFRGAHQADRNSSEEARAPEPRHGSTSGLSTGDGGNGNNGHNTGGFGGRLGVTATNTAGSSRSVSPPPRWHSVPAASQTDLPQRTGVEEGVQCDIGPSEVIKEVRMEVPVPVPAHHGGESGGGGGGRGSLMELIEALREHSSDIAHDMKNPLNGVLALSQNVLQGTFGELPQTASDQLGVVRACGYHLLNMINQLRDCLRMLHGGEPDGNCGRVQLSNAIEEVLKRMSPMVGTRITIKAEHDPSVVVYADDARLYQTVHTVLANAFKYTRRGGVTIETAAAADKNTVTLRVLDTGSGFTQEQMEKFNSPLNGTPEEQLGLGLTMVKRTMAFFGGTLRLGNKDSSGGGGGGGWVELTFRTREEVPPLSSGLPKPEPPPVATQGSAPTTAHVHFAPEAAAVPAPSAPAAACAAAAAGGSAAAAAAAASSTAAAPAPRKFHKSIVGGMDRTGQEERLAAANSSNDTNGPRNSRRDGGGGGGGGGGMPMASAGRGALGDDPLTNKGDEPVRVLIVDDDPINLTILEDLLRAEGYDVLTAASGTEALETYLTSDPQPKLVLLDVTLPDLSGHEVCLKMRSLTPGVPPPIIMISGKASTKDVIKGLQAGACDYITKPFQPQEVMARVETQLRLFMGEVAQLQEAAERNMALLRQILPPHILASLRGGTRVLVEKFSDVVVLCTDVVGFSALAAAADTADCILTLNRLFSTFDHLTDKMGVHKMDCHTDCYVAALGHMPQDRQLSTMMQVKIMLDLARAMLNAVDTMPYPDTLGKMQIRVGVHVGAVYGGVIGIKYPRYSLFGTTLRLAQGLQSTALPNTIHVTEVVHNRVRAAGGETFVPYTTSQVQSLGVIRTYLLGPTSDCPSSAGGVIPGMLDFTQLDNSVVVEYLRSATSSAHGITVLSCLLGGAAAGVGRGGVMGGSSAAGAMGLAGLVGAGAPQVLLPAAAAAAKQPPPASSSTPAAAINIIPVVSGHALSGSGGPAAGGASSAVADVAAMLEEGPNGGRRDSDGASSFAITLTHIHGHAQGDQGGQELLSTMGMAASGDMGSLSSADSTRGGSAVQGGSGGIPTAGGGGPSGAGGADASAVMPASVGVAHPAPGSMGGGGYSVGSSSTAAMTAGAATGTSTSGRRLTSEASLVQDLSPGPPAAGLSGLTRMQRMHAAAAAQPLAAAALAGGTSGPASPRVGVAGAAGVAATGPGSRSASRGPSRNTSFRIGAPGGASPLAASVMTQQLLTALQQQQQQQQQRPSQSGVQPYHTQSIPQLQGLNKGLSMTLGPGQSWGSPGSGGGGTSAAAAAAAGQITAALGSAVRIDSTGVTEELPMVGSPQSASEPLFKLQASVSDPAAAAAAASGNGMTGISSLTMRRVHMPLKTASAGALPSSGAPPAGGGIVGYSVASLGSAGGISNAGSIGSPSQFLSPVYGAVGATAAGSYTSEIAASPYAGLSDETRARLARLRTASQPDLQEVLHGRAASAAAAAAGTGSASAIGSNLPVSTASDSMLSSPPTGPVDAQALYGINTTSASAIVASAVTGPAGAAFVGATGAVHRHSFHHAATRHASISTSMTAGRTAPGGTTPSAMAPSLSPSSGRLVAAPPAQPPASVSELLDSLGLGHYSRTISGAEVGSLDELAALDDTGLRKMGLVSARSRQLVIDELRRWGLKE